MLNIYLKSRCNKAISNCKSSTCRRRNLQTTMIKEKWHLETFILIFRLFLLHVHASIIHFSLSCQGGVLEMDFLGRCHWCQYSILKDNRGVADLWAVCSWSANTCLVGWAPTHWSVAHSRGGRGSVHDQGHKHKFINGTWTDFLSMDID